MLPAIQPLFGRLSYKIGTQIVYVLLLMGMVCHSGPHRVKSSIRITLFENGGDVICIYTLDIYTSDWHNSISLKFTINTPSGPEANREKNPLFGNTNEEVLLMREVNALKIRNNLGEILDQLSATGEPVLVSKGRKLCAVLVTPEDFEKRFLDYKVKEDKKRLLDQIRALKKKKKESRDSVEILRSLRGYNA